MMMHPNVESRTIKHIKETLAEHESKLEQYLIMIEEKVDLNSFEKVMASKISKEEINELLPDMDMYEQKFMSKLEESNEKVMAKVDDKFFTQD